MRERERERERERIDRGTNKNAGNEIRQWREAIEEPIIIIEASAERNRMKEGRKNDNDGKKWRKAKNRKEMRER